MMGRLPGDLWRHFLFGVLIALSPLTRAAGVAGIELEVRQIWHLLDYVGVDYPGAVSNGAVSSEGEYREMQEFVADAERRLALLPGVTASMVSKSHSLAMLVGAKAGSGEVAAAARSLASELLAAYRVSVAPRAIPDRQIGATLYASQCSSCHGISGAGDGPAAAKLDPRPVAFTDVSRARERSLFALYQAISQGVSGTAMVGFGHLSDEQRWSLAFLVGEFAYSEELAKEGEANWKRSAAFREAIPNIEALTQATELSLELDLGADAAKSGMAFLRREPQKVVDTFSSSGGLELAKRLLGESVVAYERSDVATATRLALAAYLDGVEPLEPRLKAQNPGLIDQLETGMAKYRSQLGSQATVLDVNAQAILLTELLDRASLELSQNAGTATTSFLASFTILVREGVEALLVVVAMLAFLGKAQRRDVLPYVHAGWAGALVAGLLTWIVATYAVRISGASRELTEGFSSIFAAVVLLGVGIWMHQKSMAGRWQEYIRTKLSAALNRRSAWFLFALAFVTVYREVFETILFYIALWNETNGVPLLLGLGAGTLTLAIIAVLLLRFSRRLPIGQFFKWSSLLIAALAVVLVGKGAAALQEAGWLSVHTVAAPRVSALGVFPSAEGLLGQAVVLIAAAVGFMMNRTAGSRKPTQAE